MRTHLTHSLFAGALLVGALAALPAAGIAASAAKAQSSKPQTSSSSTHPSKSSTANTHATRGVVKSVSDSTLVITRSGKDSGDMTFTLNPSTQRQGNVAVGESVSVRYREEGKDLVATAVHAEKGKSAGHTSTPKH